MYDGCALGDGLPCISVLDSAARPRHSSPVPYARDEVPALYYELRGDPSTPTLVMIRGLGRTLRHWPEQLLTALEAHFQLLLFDNRGVGKSGPVMPDGLRAGLRRPLTTALMADDVARVMDAASVARAHVFGMSLGGMVAQEFALRHRTRLLRLVLGCTTSGGRRAERAGIDVLLALVKARLTSPRAAIEMEASVQLSEGYRLAHPEVVVEWQRLAQELPLSKDTLLSQLWAVARHNSRQRLRLIDAPTQVVSSDADRLMPPSNSVDLAQRIPDAELSWVIGAGHDYVTEQPRQCADTMRHFLLSGS